MSSNDIYLQQQLQAHGLLFDFDGKARVDGPPPSSNPMVTMAGMETSTRTDMSATPTDTWTTPTSRGSRPRPATIYEGFSFCAGDEFGSMSSWETSSIPTTHTPSDSMSRPVSMHQNFYPTFPLDTNSWGSKPCEDNLEVHHLETDMTIGQAFTTDEAIPIVDLRFPHPHVDTEALHFESALKPRRMSGSSFTMSTTGLSDIPSYDEFSAALSEAPSYATDYPPTSNRNSLMSSTQLSPVASPRMTPQSRSELVRAQSRGHGASPSPRPGMRSVPYCMDNSSRSKRWSTGSYGTNSNRRASPFVYHHTHDAFGARMPSHHSSPTVPNSTLPLNYGNLQAMQQYPFVAPHPSVFRNGMVLPSQLPPHLPSNGFHPEPHHYENVSQLMPHGLFRMLQSNADPHSLHGHYADLSDPPDLYSSLQEEQIPPPPEDMNPSDPDLVPHEQELRFEGDLYTPKWVRGHGNKREGWCGICKPGRWLVLKNSAFWYDKSFTHGISAATGNPFQEPQEARRMDGSPDVWEGLCGSCNDWIALVSSKKKGTTWFRHAYKCHTHPKIKDAPKRRRESSHSRVLATAQIAKSGVDQQRPVTPQRTTTPTPASVLHISQYLAPRQAAEKPTSQKSSLSSDLNMI